MLKEKKYFILRRARADMMTIRLFGLDVDELGTLQEADSVGVGKRARNSSTVRSHAYDLQYRQRRTVVFHRTMVPWGFVF